VKPDVFIPTRWSGTVKWINTGILTVAALAVGPTFGGQGAAGQNAAGDRAAVEAAVRDYVEALYDVEPAKIERSVHRRWTGTLTTYEGEEPFMLDSARPVTSTSASVPG
jgi:hypothetical protein